NLISKIKENKAKIINILHGGRGTSAYLHKETKELQEKLSDYKKLEQYLPKARIALTQILNTKKSFADYKQRKFLYEEDNNKICEGAYKILNSMKEDNYLGAFVANLSLIELEKNIAEIQKSTQRLSHSTFN
ncbi:19989_t:CDS:2, partial [Racocetra fulgida]